MPGTGSPHTPLAAILRSFTAPISEEHGWAIIHQSCLALAAAPAPLHLAENTEQLLLTRDGLVAAETWGGGDPGRKPAASLAQAVAELGVVVYSGGLFNMHLSWVRTVELPLSWFFFFYQVTSDFDFLCLVGQWAFGHSRSWFV